MNSTGSKEIPIPEDIRDFIKIASQNYADKKWPDKAARKHNYVYAIEDYGRGLIEMYRQLNASNQEEKPKSPWIKASIQLPEGHADKYPFKLPIQWRGIMFIASWDVRSKSFNGDFGCLSTIEHFEGTEWLDISVCSQEEKPKGSESASQYLHFKSASHQSERDYFTIRMEGEEGQRYVTEFNGKFGRLLFDKQIVKKAADCRKVLEVLLEGYSDTWPGYITDKVTSAIDNAKTFNESPDDLSALAQENERLKGERDEYRILLEELSESARASDMPSVANGIDVILNKYPNPTT